MKKDTLFIRFLYHTIPGRLILRILVRPQLSRKAGVFLNSGYSRWLIPLFVKKNGISLKGYEEKFGSFNVFFTRRRSVEQIDITPKHLISPCDGLLSVYPVGKDRIYRIKHVAYELERLLENKKLAQHFSGGWCLIFRLTPSHYHRYCYICSGVRKESKRINGKLHCVRPAAYTSVPVFVENSREYVKLESDILGTLVQMEVGALLVGKIHNHPAGLKVMRGQEKGYFEFGGSTIIVLLEKERVKIKKEIMEHSRRMEETEVRMGEKIGEIQIGRGSA